jgi:hypothetical protein
LNILPIPFEFFALKFILKCLEYFRHSSLPPRFALVLAQFKQGLQGGTIAKRKLDQT